MLFLELVKMKNLYAVGGGVGGGKDEYWWWVYKFGVWVGGWMGASGCLASIHQVWWIYETFCFSIIIFFYMHVYGQVGYQFF